MITQTSFVSELKITSPQWLAEHARVATMTTFDKICSEPTGDEITPDGDNAQYDGVIGNISFVGDLNWSLILGFPHLEKLKYYYRTFLKTQAPTVSGQKVAVLLNRLNTTLFSHLIEVIF